MKFTTALMNGIAIFMAVACTIATFTVYNQIVSPPTSCVGPSFYEVQKPTGAWNKRWKRFIYPPQSGNYGDVSCCSSNAPASSEWKTLPTTCPSGCSSGTCSLGGCHSEYEARAVRFNSCMEKVRLAAKCPPHVNDTGRMYSHYQRNAEGELDRFAADFDPVTNRRAVFLDMDDFLDDCEARISYAEQRNEYGSTILVVFLIPTFAWLLIVAEMLFSPKKRSQSKAEMAVEKAEMAVEKAEAASTAGDIVDKVQQNNKYTVPSKPDTSNMISNSMKSRPTAEEATGKILSISETLSEKLKRKNWKCAIALRACTKSAYFELFKFVFGSFTTLASQQGTFLSPTNRYVTDQLLLGSAIIASAIGTPILHVWKADIVHVLYDGFFCLFFAGIAIMNLVGFFLEEEGGTGVVHFEQLSGFALLNKCQAAVIPLLSFALLIRGHWNASLRAVVPSSNIKKTQKDFDTIQEPIVEVMAVPVVENTNKILPLEMLEEQSKEVDNNDGVNLDSKTNKQKEKEVGDFMVKIYCFSILLHVNCTNHGIILSYFFYLNSGQKKVARRNRFSRRAKMGKQNRRTKKNKELSYHAVMLYLGLVYIRHLQFSNCVGWLSLS